MGLFWEKDTGFQAFIANMKATKGTESVFVGWLRSSGTYNKPARAGRKRAPKAPGSPGWKSSALGGGESLTIAQLAAILEFGTKDGRIPERPALRYVMRAHKDKIAKVMAKAIVLVALGKMTEKQALGVLGQFVADLVRKRIQDGIPPPNKASTVRRKGSSKPWIDTGQVVGAIDFEVRKAGK